LAVLLAQYEGEHVDFTADNLTEAVVKAYSEATRDPRLRIVLARLIHHLHAFAKDVRLTESEWLAGIRFLTATGKHSGAKRQEFILLSDVLGLSMLLETMSHPRAASATANTVLGPFYVPDAPELPACATTIRKASGVQRILVKGSVTDLASKPIAGAVLDVWQAAANGLYHMQDRTAPEWNLCGRFRSGPHGEFAFVTERPAPYPIPTDGPVGELLRATGRSAMRPAHIHFIVTADGYDPLTTHLFLRGDPHLDTDPVFATKSSLVADCTFCSDETLAAEFGLESPFELITWTFGLMPSST
jgi:catechol 1,2-dioxygenase